jgi:protein-L-isoaspartate(D-aspartate) O-methyltransferase
LTYVLWGKDINLSRANIEWKIEEFEYRQEMSQRRKFLLLGLTAVILIAAVSTFLAFRSMSQKGVELEEEAMLTEARRRMVETDLMGRDITDKRVLEVMGTVPRHKFVDKSLHDEAYGDHPLPISEGQTISQPYVVALMTQSLQLNGSEKVLEIGTGSGYQAAVLAELVDEVYTVEIREPLAEGARRVLDDLGYSNVYVKCADGYFGWEEHAPFDAVMVTCAVNHVPPYLIDQLKDGGRLIIPLGIITYYQTLTVFEKNNDTLDSTYITSVIFVPMTGEAEKH